MTLIWLCLIYIVAGIMSCILLFALGRAATVGDSQFEPAPGAEAGSDSGPETATPTPGRCDYPMHPDKDEAVLCWGDDCPGDGSFTVPFGKGHCQYERAILCQCMRKQQGWRFDT